MSRGVSDIVRMALPTQWTPGASWNGKPQTGVPSSYVQGAPGSQAFPSSAPGSASQGGLTPGVGPTGLSVPPVPTGGAYTPGSDPYTAPGNWDPTRLVPDSALPPALRRDRDIRRYYAPNAYDVSLMSQARMWQWIAEHGGLRSCCIVPELGRPLWSQPPWQVMPSNGLAIAQMFAIDTDQVITSPDQDITVGSYVVEQGYDGVVNRIVLGFTGQGFADFSGDLIWRVMINNRYAKTLGAVQNQFASFETAYVIPGYGIRVVSGQTIKIQAFAPTGTGISGGKITGGIFGWVYPRR